MLQQFVGSAWPDGNPAELRSAAAAWRAAAGPLNGAGADVSGAHSPITGQRIDEADAIAAHIDGIATGLSDVAGSCDALAASVEQYAARVEKTQQAIRDLCDRLGSIGGIVGTFFEFLHGHGLDEVHQIADEIKTVIAHLGSETDATLQLLESAKQSVDSWVLDLEKSANKEFVDFFGEPVGTVLSSQFNQLADSTEGVFRWGTGFVEGIAALDPTRFASDPEGARQTWEGLDKFGRLLANPLLAVMSDPHGSLETAKGLVHAEDWSKERPMLGATEVGLDVASTVFPFTKAGALGKAGGATRAVEGSEEAGTALRAGGEFGSSTSTLSDLGKDTASTTEKLNDLAKEPISPTPSTGGQPMSLPGDAEHGPTPAAKAPTVEPRIASTEQPAPDRVPATASANSAHSGTPTPEPEHAPTLSSAAHTPIVAPTVADHVLNPVGNVSPADDIVHGAGHVGTTHGGSGAGSPEYAQAEPVHGSAMDHGPRHGAGHAGGEGTLAPTHGGANPSHGHAHEPDGDTVTAHHRQVGDDSGRDIGAESSVGDTTAAGDYTDRSAAVEGHDYGFSPEHALENLQNPARDLERLRHAGVPIEVLHGYDPLAGRTIDAFEREFTVAGSDGRLHWDWDGQAPNDGFAGPPTIIDRIPAGQELDRLGSNSGGFLADIGAPLSTRAMPPGVASDYHEFVGTGRPVPDGLPWEVRYGPAKEAFGQPGGANQWVVFDMTTLRPVPTERLLLERMIIER